MCFIEMHVQEEMEAGVAAGAFLEHAGVHGNMYGTSLKAVVAVCAAGKIPVLDIDVQGAAKVSVDLVMIRCCPHTGLDLMHLTKLIHCITKPAHRESTLKQDWQYHSMATTSLFVLMAS